MHILGPLLSGRSRALCRLLGSFWPRNRSPVNLIFERAASRVGRGGSGQLSGGAVPTGRSGRAGFQASAERRDRLEQPAAQGEKDGELTEGALELRIVLHEKERPAQHERPREDADDEVNDS